MKRDSGNEVVHGIRGGRKRVGTGTTKAVGTRSKSM